MSQKSSADEKTRHLENLRVLRSRRARLRDGTFATVTQKQEFGKPQNSYNTDTHTHLATPTTITHTNRPRLRVGKVAERRGANNVISGRQLSSSGRKEEK